jgi:hypothetical protein
MPHKLQKSDFLNALPSVRPVAVGKFYSLGWGFLWRHVKRAHVNSKQLKNISYFHALRIGMKDALLHASD